MTEQTPDIPMLNVDGQNHVIADLPPDIQELISYYQTWEGTLKSQRLEAFKTEAAMRSLTNEITTRVKMMVASKAAKEAADAAEGAKLKEEATASLISSLEPAANDPAEPAANEQVAGEEQLTEE